MGVCGTARRPTRPLQVSGTELALAGKTAELVFPPQAERTTERSGVVRSLETKFLLFWVRQEQDGPFIIGMA